MTKYSYLIYGPMGTTIAFAVQHSFTLFRLLTLLFLLSSTASFTGLWVHWAIPASCLHSSLTNHRQYFTVLLVTMGNSQPNFVDLFPLCLNISPPVTLKKVSQIWIQLLLHCNVLIESQVSGSSLLPEFFTLIKSTWDQINVYIRFTIMCF